MPHRRPPDPHHPSRPPRPRSRTRETPDLTWGEQVEIDATGEVVSNADAGCDDASSGSPPTLPPSEPPDGHHGVRPSREIARIEAPYASSLPPWIEVLEPEDPNALSTRLVMVWAPNSVAAQQFRSLRYRIEQEPEAQMFAIVSPHAGEGKSVTAANLALALAEGGRVRVLLIDAALRAPVQARLFGTGTRFGLSALIARRRTNRLTTIPVYRIQQSLYVLPAGPRANHPHAILGSEPAAQILGDARKAFRYVIVDASAVFGPAETLAWHGMIDRYILLARRGRTRTDDLARAADRLNRDKVLGVAFVGAFASEIVA